MRDAAGMATISAVVRPVSGTATAVGNDAGPGAAVDAGCPVEVVDA